jgi:hypothetical protein
VVLPSLHPKKTPGVWHFVEDGAAVLGDVSVGSLHPPNQPGEWQVVEELVVEVFVGMAWEVLVLLVVVISSLQPNQPGVLHVAVEVVVVVLVVVVVTEVVVVSSKHPHQPGVLQVEMSYD